MLKSIFCIILLYSSLLYSQSRIKIQDAINLSSEHNPNVSVYAFNAEIQKAEIITAKTRPNIIFNNQSIFLTDQNYLNLIRPDQTMFISPYASQLWFQVTKQYQVAGKRHAKIDLQTRKYEFAERDQEDFKNNIAYQAANKWLDVWHAKVKMEIVLQAEANMDTLLAITEKRLKKNEVNIIDLTRTQIMDEEYNTMEFAARQKYKSELLKLAYMIGNKDTVDIDSEADFFFKDLPDELDTLLRVAYESRTDVKAIEAQIRIANASVKYNKTLAKPNPEAGLILNPQNRQPYLGWYFQIPIAIFDRNQGMIQRSIIEKEQKENLLNSTLFRMKSELTYTMQEYEVYRANSERYREIEENADLMLKTIRTQYIEGKTTVVDYLLAKQNWYRTQESYYEALFLYRKSYIDLMYACGLLIE